MSKICQKYFLHRDEKIKIRPRVHWDRVLLLLLLFSIQICKTERQILGALDSLALSESVRSVYLILVELDTIRLISILSAASFIAHRLQQEWRTWGVTWIEAMLSNHQLRTFSKKTKQKKTSVSFVLSKKNSYPYE